MPFSCTKKMVMTGIHVVNFCNQGTWNIYNTRITVKLLMYTYTHCSCLIYFGLSSLSPHLSPNLVWGWFIFYLRCLAKVNKIWTTLSAVWGLLCGHLQNILVKWNRRKEQSLKLFTGQNQTLQLSTEAAKFCFRGLSVKSLKPFHGSSEWTWAAGEQIVEQVCWKGLCLEGHLRWPGLTYKKVPIHVTFCSYEMWRSFRARAVGLICFVSIVCRSCDQLVPCLAKRASSLYTLLLLVSDPDSQSNGKK